MSPGTEPILSPDPRPLEPGAQLGGRLVIGALLGSGGMGRVYAARDQLKDQEIALKLLRRDVAANSYARERFLVEARICCDLSHDNIVRVYDVAQSGPHIYLTMERLHGQSLREIVNRCKNDRRLLPIVEVNHLAHQLIEALRYAHRRQVVHRDIKPENIWVCAGPERTVKLMDFGIARALAHTDLTHTGMAMGTAYYVAPEQWASAKAADWRADQYSLGVVLYELLTGFLPMGNAQPLEEVRPDLPKRYARALMRAISQKPDHRWPSFDALSAELQLTQRTFPTAAVASIVAIIVVLGAAALYFSVDRPRIAASEASSLPSVVRAAPSMPLNPARAPAGVPQTLVDPDLTPHQPQSVPSTPLAGLIPEPLPAAQPPPAPAPMESSKVVPPIPSEPGPAEPAKLAVPVAVGMPEREPLSTFQDKLQDGSPGPRMVVMPEGRFLMGSVPTEVGHEPDEAPQHGVTVRSFALASSEVTFAEYDRFALVTKRRLLGPKDGSRRERPVVRVSWKDATAYAKWLSEQTGKSYRLPTEAEWEYAARAGSPTKMPFGTGTCISPAQANFNTEDGGYAGCNTSGKPLQRSKEVGSYAQSAFKLHDMHGNVWEWVQDCYHSSYASAPDDGSAWLAQSGGDCTRRVLRGGSWRFGPRFLRSAERTDPIADATEDHIGFRLARDL
jgi:formylglycine-generating enzyme required for sulfatase activity/tRNA A-37 threonylcarbamoyl transferase component Bud32